MTVADLIAELQRFAPQREVRIAGGLFDGSPLSLGPADSVPADRVTNQGGYVLIEGERW